MDMHLLNIMYLISGARDRREKRAKAAERQNQARSAPRQLGR